MGGGCPDPVRLQTNEPYAAYVYIHTLLPTHLLDGEPIRDKLLPGGHVHSVDVGALDRGGGRGEVHLVGAGAPEIGGVAGWLQQQKQLKVTTLCHSPDHVDDLAHGGAPDDRVIDQEDVLALKSGESGGQW